MIKKSSFSCRVRKSLSDISNIGSHQKSPLKEKENSVPTVDDSSTNIYVQQLLKENAAMVKLIQEKDKIIEMNVIELQKLRANLQRTQLQNLQLAQSNTQMLAELNTGKDRLKAIQHQLSLKDAWYKAKMLEYQEKAKTQGEANSMQMQEGETKLEKATVEKPTQESNNEYTVSTRKRGRTTRSQSLGSTTAQQTVDKEIAENKRRCLRSQSAILKVQETVDDFFEIDGLNTPITIKKEQPLHEVKSGNADKKEHLAESLNHSASRRKSTGRPVRSSTKKVLSYKDSSLKVKLRRPS